MGFRLQVALGAVLMSAAAAAVAMLQEWPRLQVAAALVLLSAAGWGWRALQSLTRPLPVAVPEFGFDAHAAEEKLALIDGQIEHMPVALWEQPEGGAVQPLNARARRLLAPGGVVEREALLQALAATPSGHLLRIQTERGEERWLSAGTRVALAGQDRRLLALLPVESELEAAALTAWQQLVHVLTHEIMNSLTPIASLSRSARELQGDPAAAEDLTLALETIARRSEALSRFVANYRRISELPPPRLEALQVADVFARIQQWAGADWRERGGALHCEVEPATLSLMSDPDQLEQALLNLVKNAAEATAGMAAPRLDLRARLARGGRLMIEVRDNGPGVPAELESRIFMPFVSGRAQAAGADARGIGLAVVRNLVHGMGGTVRHVRVPQGGACFVLSF
ncbi:PAS domain-containing sensor histidine kinase [Burkholderiaceae bacterium UC74_6]